MIGKKEYTNTIELQLLKKEKASLESKVFKQQQDQQLLKEKVVNLESEKETLKQLIDRAEKGSISQILLKDVKLRSNIRDEYEFEEIEDLATDIIANSQLQPALITNDNYLVSGHRRYYAVKLINSDNQSPKLKDMLENSINKPDYLVVYKLAKNSSEISDLELADLQYSENNERRSIDNFQLSKMYNSYLNKGFDQKDLVTKFKKTKGIISSIVSLKKVDPVLVRFLKEFQIFAWSKSRFIEETKSEMNDLQEQFYQNNRGIIGWKPLYNLAKQEDFSFQREIFLNLYKNRLTEQELNSEYFSETITINDSDQDKLIIINSAIKHTKEIYKLIAKLDKNPMVDNIINDIKSIEKRLSDFCD
ncbi:MAG: ParB N-terminal domain-containing protein [Candidatus Sericytochromatia bacterium]|nr:ParB N-terminal domain-containing protein [Candidatus Sericytochromatia bacterium]